MKKLLTVLILSLALIRLSAHPVVEKTAVPETESVAQGFVVIDRGRFDPLGADTILYEHITTGAKVLFLSNEDTNRVFEITFLTPAETDTGVPHVFEHSTLGGSEKYPSKTVFFNLLFQTYNTYMNASTYDIMTTYPIASLSEDQLLKYADFYTDSCFNPMVCYDKSIFDEEAWRYTLDENGDLALEGTVYSEMRGVYSRQQAAYYNFMKTVFPRSIAGNDSGGNPDHISEMTWNDLLEYHEKYYTPSNSVTCIYGKIDDINAFLTLLDGYFSSYEKTSFDFTDSLYTPIEESVGNTYEYAVEASTDTENASTVYYGFVVGKLSLEELARADFLASLLNSSSSVLMEALKTALPYGSFSCQTSFSGPEDLILFTADNIKEEDTELFKRTVDEAMVAIYEDGFDRDSVDALISSLRLSIALTRENSSVGVNTLPYIMYYWAATGDIYGYMKYFDLVDDFPLLVEDGTLIRVLKENIIDNTRSALAVTTAVRGLRETKDEELFEKLQNIKESMSEEEIKILSESEEENADDRSREYVSSLTAVDVESLPEEIRLYSITDETGEDGIRRISAVTDTSGVGYSAFLLNTDWVEKDKLHYLKLYTDLIDELDTPEHTRSQLSVLSDRYLYDGRLEVTTIENIEKNEYHPYVLVSFISLDEDTVAAYSVIDELLYDGILDPKRIADIVSNTKEDIKNSVNYYSHDVLLSYMSATVSGSKAYDSYMNYLEYYRFLESVSRLLEENPEEVVSELEYIQKNLRNSYKAISLSAGNEESIALRRRAADEFFSHLEYREVPSETYEFEKMKHSRALVVESNVNYNLMFASYEDLGLEKFTADLKAISSLLNDSYLMPSLRDRYGVYGAYARASEYGLYLYTYRDPNISETFDVYSGLPLYMDNLKDLDQESLDGYILSSYSSYANADGELNGAKNAIFDHLAEKPQERKIRYMEELKSLTPEKVAAYTDAYSLLVEKGLYGTSGPSSSIEKYSRGYEEILDPFKAE